MKRTLMVLTGLLASLISFSQEQFIDDYSAERENRSGYSYDQLIFEVTLVSDDKFERVYAIQLLQAKPSSRGYYSDSHKKYFSCALLGSFCNPMNIGNVSFDLFYTRDGKEHTFRHSLSQLRQKLEFKISKITAGSQNAAIEMERINVIQAGTSAQTDVLAYKRIQELEAGKTNTTAGTANRAGSNPSATSTTGRSSTEVAVTASPAQASASNPNAHDATLQAYKDRQAQSQREADAATQHFTSTLTTVIGNMAAEAQERRRERQAKAQKEYEDLQRQEVQRVKDFNEYTALLNQKAAAGDLVAMRRLGSNLTRYKRDVKTGLFWLEKAALSGDLNASMLLNQEHQYAYTEEAKVTKRKWQAIAADLGDMESVHNLIDEYSKMPSGPANSQKAMEWIQYGVQKGDLYAKRHLALIFRDGKLNNLEFKEHQNTANARLLFEELAKSEDGEESYFALTSLAQMYKEGIGVEKDTKKAARLKAAAEDVKDKRMLPKTFIYATATDYSQKIVYVSQPIVCYSGKREMKVEKEPREALVLIKDKLRFPGIGQYNVSSDARNTLQDLISLREYLLISDEERGFTIKEIQIDFTYDKREKVALPF